MSDPRGKLDRAAVWYSGNPHVRAAVSGAGTFVPVLAAALDAWLGTIGSELAQKRRDALIEELHTAFSRLDESKVDKHYLQSEEWADLLFNAIHASVRTRSRDKVRLFAHILAGAAVASRADDLDIDAVLGTLEALTPTEISIAGQMYEAIQNHPLAVVDGLADLPPGPDADFHRKRLEAAGLIAARQPNGMTFQHMDTYHLTPTFHRIVNLLRSAGYKPSSETDVPGADDSGP